MKLEQVVKKQSLLGKPQLVGKIEEGGTDHHYPRTTQEKGLPKEETVLKPTRKAPKEVVVRPKEKLVGKGLFMTERDKRPEVMMRAKELLVLAVAEVAKAVETRVAKAPPLEPTTPAMKSTTPTVKSTMKPPMTS